MLAEQGGGCAACGATTCSDKRRSRLSVDHDHVTGRVRGLLCNDCNRALGLLKDSPDVVKRLLAHVSGSAKE